MEENNVHVYEVQEDITIEETIDVVEVSETEVYEVFLDEAFPPMGSRNDELNHALLNNRELPDQHPIMAITGLRQELDGIEALQTIYSNEKGCADYYEWADGNTFAEDRIGYFVTLNQDTRTIAICAGDHIFGVVVDNAAFIGGQDNIVRDFSYGLVATSGPVHIRCELDVAEGDYVVSNEYGIAKKSNSNYGYLVVALHDVSGTQYATIKLNISATQVEALGVGLQDLDDRVDVAEKNITSAINLANQAYNKAGEVSEEALKNALEALDKADNAVADVDKMNEVVSSTNQMAVQAKALAESAVTSAEAIHSQAVTTANDALANVNDLIENLEPISQWKDPETGNIGAEYLTTYIENGLATKAEIQTVETMTENNKSAILQNTESIRTMICSVDKYSVGEYSNANGLTLELAQSILEVGMVYVPTVDHIETYTDFTQTFTTTYYYVWDGAMWLESGSPLVNFSDIYIVGSDIAPYWYIPGDDNIIYEDITYESKTLYWWHNNQWIAVATLKGNINNRAISNIRQTANEIALEVTNARGTAATLGARITDTESEVQTLATWSKDANGNQYNLATIKQTADDAGASISQVVESVGKDGEVTAASIVAAVNDAESVVRIDADHIQFDGFVSFASKGEVEEVQNASVYDVKVEYALSSSATDEPTSGWDTTAPEWQEGQYMWQKTTITKGNKSVSSTVACIQGAKGQDGEDGKTPIKGVDYFDGSNGKDGVGIQSTTVTYGTSTSADIKPTSWQNEIPNVAEGNYLWTRTIIDYTDNNRADTVTYTYSKQGEKGESGAAGTSVMVQSIKYQAGTSATSAPTGTWSNNIVEVPEGQYLWTQTTFSDGKVAYGVAKQGTSGTKGDDGISVTNVITEYCLSTSNTITPTTGWTTNLNSLNWTPSNYIWCRERIVYSKGNPTYTTPRVDESLSLVGQWCSTANKTYIDGGKIYTGSITANQLAANSITAGKMSVDSLSSITANLGEITAGIAKSPNYIAGTSGLKIDFTNGIWDSPHFKITSGGNVEISGNVVATSGKIGDCTITEDGQLLVPCANITDLTVDAAQISGTLSADQIEASGLTVSTAQVTGLLVDGKIDVNLINAEAINAKIAQIGDFTISSGTLSAGAEEGNAISLSSGGLSCSGSDGVAFVTSSGRMGATKLYAGSLNVGVTLEDLLSRVEALESLHSGGGGGDTDECQHLHVWYDMCPDCGEDTMWTCDDCNAPSYCTNPDCPSNTGGDPDDQWITCDRCGTVYTLDTADTGDLSCPEGHIVITNFCPNCGYGGHCDDCDEDLWL